MSEEADSNESKILEEPVVEAQALSCDDIPDFAVLCSFLDRFGQSLSIPSSIKELQAMLEQRENVSEQLIDIHVKLLRRIMSGAQKNRYENYLIRFCENYLFPYNYSLVVRLQKDGYAKLDLSSKVHILKGLLELQFEFHPKFKQTVNERTPEDLRLLSLGRDVEGMVYWLQVDEDLNVRLFREDLDDEHSFKLIHKTKDELKTFLEDMKQLKDKKFKGENIPKRPSVTKEEPGIKVEPPDVKKEEQTGDAPEIKTEIKQEVGGEDKKEDVEDLCVRPCDSARLEGQSTTKTKLENEAHCPVVKSEAANDGQPEAAHSASSKEVPDEPGTAATDLSLPHLPTPPHEQEQILPAPPLSAVHSPPVPHKKAETDGTVDHAAEDLSTAKKEDDDDDEDALHIDEDPKDEEHSSEKAKLEEAEKTDEIAEKSDEELKKEDIDPQKSGDVEERAEEVGDKAEPEVEESEQRDSEKDSEADVVPEGKELELIARETAAEETAIEENDGVPDDKTEETAPEDKKGRTASEEKEEGTTAGKETDTASRDDVAAASEDKEGAPSDEKGTVASDLEESEEAVVCEDEKAGAIGEQDAEPSEDKSIERKPDMEVEAAGERMEEQSEEKPIEEAIKSKEDDGVTAKDVETQAEESAKKDSDEKEEEMEDEEEGDQDEEDEDKGEKEEAEVGVDDKKLEPEVEMTINDEKVDEKVEDKTDEVEREKEEEVEEEVQKKPKKMSREARLLLQEAERLTKLQDDEEDEDFSGRPRRSCRRRREVEKYTVSDDESSKKKRKSKAEKDEDKEVTFTVGKNAKAARKAAKEMIRAQKLAHKALMRKLKGKKKRGKKGDSDDDDLESVEFGDDDEEEEDEEITYDQNDEDEFACDEEIKDQEFNPEEIKKARTAKKGDEDEVDDEPCRKCSKSDHPEFILLCDTCDAGYHMSCLKPALMVIPLGNWYCPPCEHDALLSAVSEKISFIENEWSLREKEITRKQRLAFVSINIGNVLTSKRDVARPCEDGEDFEDDESEISEVGSSDGAEYSEDSAGETRRRRAAKKGDAIREKMQEYDKMMKEAIDEEGGAPAEQGDPAKKRTGGKDMSNILPESDEEGVTAQKRGKRRKSKLSDLNADDSEEDDDSEFQASDYSEIEVNKRKKSKKKRDFDSEEENSDEGSDASWGRTNVKSSRRSGGGRKNPLARESSSSKKKGKKWDDYDSEASQSFEASSDDSGDFCKPRKRQAVNYAESSDESEEPKGGKGKRKSKPSDEEVSLDDEDEEEEEEESLEEDVSNEESVEKDDDESDEDNDDEDDDDEEDDDDDSDSSLKKRKKAKKAAKKKKKESAKVKPKPVAKAKRPAPIKKKKKKKKFDDDDSDSDSWGPKRKRSKATVVDEQERRKTNGRAVANKARSKLIESDGDEDVEEEEVEEEEEAPKAWPPLPSHLMANMSKTKKADSPPEVAKEEPVVPPVQNVMPPAEVAPPMLVETAVCANVPQMIPMQIPVTVPVQSTPIQISAPIPIAQTVPVIAGQAVLPGQILAKTAPLLVRSAGHPAQQIYQGPSIAMPPHHLAAPTHNGVRPMYAGQYAPGASTMGQYYQNPGYVYPPQYGYPTQHGAHLPGYVASVPSYGQAYGQETYAEWGPTAPQAQVVAAAPSAAIEEKAPENFSISNILHQENPEDMDSVTSIGKLMGK